MISCPDKHEFSPSSAAKRQEAACKILGSSIVARIVGFALFILGAKRQIAADTIGMPVNTFLAFTTRVSKNGLDGFRDRRRNTPVQDPATQTEPLQVQIDQQQDATILHLADKQLVLPLSNPTQKRVVLLTLAESGLLSNAQVAELLGCSREHARRLARKLKDEDASVLIDQRQGQKIDYRVPVPMKAQMVVTWAANVVAGKKISGEALAEELADTHGQQVSPRTIRHHLHKLGLTHASTRLKALIAEKKSG